MHDPTDLGLGTAGRRDGRRGFLSYLDPKLMKAVKMAALEQDPPAYEIVEVALAEWLKKNPRAK